MLKTGKKQHEDTQCKLTTGILVEKEQFIDEI